MKSILTRIQAGLAALLLLLAAGCRTGDTDSAPPDGQVAMGRYVESQYPLPDDIQYVAMLDMDDSGVLHLMANNKSYYNWYETENLPAWNYWTSADNGRTWEEQRPAWKQELELSALEFAALDPNGGFYIGYSVPGEDFEDPRDNDNADEPEYTAAEDVAEAAEEETDTLEFVLADDEDFVNEAWRSTFRFARVGEEGLTPIPEGFPFGKYGSTPSTLQVLEDGTFLYGYYGEFSHVDAAGNEINSYEPRDYSPVNYGNHLIYGGSTLVLSDGQGVMLYDLATGDSEELLSSQASESEGELMKFYNDMSVINAIAVDAEASALYSCQSSGVYRTVIGGAVSERLIDGELTTLNMPAYSINRLLLPPDESILVHVSDNEDNGMLLHYVYDPNTPTVPSTELKVYSLEENATVRQAMGLFRQQKPDVKVTYEVGVTGGDGITAADALRTLSTALLAGDGPDVLVLDGMPVDSYMEKNILMDMGSALNDLLSGGGLVENVAGTWRQGNTLHAVPARFSVPMLLAVEEIPADSLTGMADWLEAHPEEKILHGNGSYLLDVFYPLYAPRLFREDNSLDGEAFTRFLTDLERMSRVEGLNNPADPATANLEWSAVPWNEGFTAFGEGELTALKIAAAPWSAIRQREEGVLSVMENGAGGVYIPRTVLGVNSQSAMSELAVEFVRFALSDEVQAYSFDDGLPVNRQALLAGVEYPESAVYDQDSEYPIMTYGYGWSEDGDPAMLNIYWPDEEFLLELIETVSKVETPSPVDQVVRRMVEEETESLWAGQRSVEDTVSGFRQKYDLYIAEQG